MRLIEDIICILLLVFIPDFILHKLHMYDSMIAIREVRDDN